LSQRRGTRPPNHPPEPLLAEIPDADLALFASIELATGMLGLPQPSGMRKEYHPRRYRK
jgi:hypothetical protein